MADIGPGSSHASPKDQAELPKGTHVPSVIDGRPAVPTGSGEGFTVFSPLRNPDDPSKGTSDYPHVRVNDNGSSHVTDLVVHPTDSGKFGEGSVRMVQHSMDLKSKSSGVVDSRTRVSTSGSQVMHRTRDEALSPPGSVSPRTQGNTAPRFDVKF